MACCEHICKDCGWSVFQNRPPGKCKKCGCLYFIVIFDEAP